VSLSGYIADVETRRQIMIQRLSGGVYRKLSPVLNDMRRDIVARLADNPTDFQQARLTRLLIEIDDIISGRVDEFAGQMQLDLEAFLKAETQFQAKLLDKVITVDSVLPTIEQIRASVDNTAFKLVSGNQVKRLTTNMMIDEFASGQKKAIRSLLTAAIIEGQTVDQATRAVSRLVNTRSRQQARTVVRTAFNHAGTVARAATYQANADVIESEKFVSTLDSRTTLTCSGYDSQVFAIGQGPQPPLHYGCRSVRVPIIKEQFRVKGLEGERASVGADGPEPVSGTKTFGGWLKDQPLEFQNEYLGEERAKLFRSGKVKISQFTDDEGRVLSLEELQRIALF
jgi:SPP1 gp7 family putative phage head morphogenesis protein